MSAIEWNKKEDLLQDQALRHLKQYTTLFSAFSTNFKSELILLNKIQEYCYDNMNFLKTFNKIVLLFYKSKKIANLSYNGKDSAITNCCISGIGAIKLHPFGTSAEQSEERLPKVCNFIAPQALIQQLVLYFIAYL